MTTKNQEIPLSTTWLNSREKFDTSARNPMILQKFLQNIENHNGSFSIADLGCGTGSNVLYLSERINHSCIWYLVEREAYLLEESKKRLQAKFSDSWIEKENAYHASNNGKQITFHFCNETVESFLHKQTCLHAVSASALFDLFTEKEFSQLHTLLTQRKIILYSVLNYTGMKFSPEHELDNYYISLFEAHMSRKLSKGQPMGADTIGTIKQIVQKKDDSSIYVDTSNWLVNSSEESFLRMNFNFYNDAIQNIIPNSIDAKKYNIWLKEKEKQINIKKLNLIVEHQDFITIPKIN